VTHNRYTCGRIRYFINRENRSTVAEALSDIAYRHITKKLVGGELTAGQKLSEQTIAAECGISRTPVREAVRRLTEEACSTRFRPRHVCRAAGPAPVIDAFEVRMALESFAMERAVRTLTKETAPSCARRARPCTRRLTACARGAVRC
jgi:DNA-binding GntR family transcriptional regulator